MGSKVYPVFYSQFNKTLVYAFCCATVSSEEESCLAALSFPEMVDLRCYLDVMPMIPCRHNQENIVAENLLTDNINQLPTNKKNIMMTFHIHREAVLLKQQIVVPAITYKKEPSEITDNVDRRKTTIEQSSLNHQSNPDFNNLQI